jgi:hypothetical protein
LHVQDQELKSSVDPVFDSLYLGKGSGADDPETTWPSEQGQKESDKGTKLDVRLSDGSHHIGTLSQTGSTSFVIVDPVSSKSESVDYLDVKRVQPTRKEYVSKQLGKTVNGIPKSAEIALIAVGVGLLLAVLAGGIHD